SAKASSALSNRAVTKRSSSAASAPAGARPMCWRTRSTVAVMPDHSRGRVAALSVVAVTISPVAARPRGPLGGGENAARREDARCRRHILGCYGFPPGGLPGRSRPAEQGLDRQDTPPEPGGRSEERR